MQWAGGGGVDVSEEIIHGDNTNIHAPGIVGIMYSPPKTGEIVLAGY
jgi:hypothetical protein